MPRRTWSLVANADRSRQVGGLEPFGGRDEDGGGTCERGGRSPSCARDWARPGTTQETVSLLELDPGAGRVYARVVYRLRVGPGQRRSVLRPDEGPR